MENTREMQIVNQIETVSLCEKLGIPLLETDPEKRAAIIEAENNDPEIAARKEAHIEQIIDRMVQLGWIKLTDEPDPRQAEYESLRELLRRQYITDEHHDKLAYYAEQEKSCKHYCEALLLIDIFNYGRICGKREERARRNKGVRT